MFKTFFNKSDISKELRRLDKKICCTQPCEICSFIDALDLKETPINSQDVLIVKDSNGDCWKAAPNTLCDLIPDLEVTNSSLVDGDIVPIQNQEGCMSRIYKGFYVEVTYAEAQTLVSVEGLTPGAMYKITDRGDRGIFLDAVSTTKFNIEGVRIMLIPNREFGIGHGNIYIPDETYSIGEIVVYYGLIYENTTGLNTAPPDNNIDFTLIPKESFENNEYVEKSFGVIYDFENDWIEKQWDTHGNIFGISKVGGFNYIFNPVDVSDWWLATVANGTHSIFNSNVAVGIWNNYVGKSDDNYKMYNNYVENGPISDNFFAKIIDNKVICDPLGGDPSFGIVGNGDYNTNKKVEIVLNDVSYSLSNNDAYFISVNKLPAGINGNVCDSILNNMNNGGIDGCIIGGSIYNNLNNGGITAVTESVGSISIYNNVNNGTIGAGAYAADITDIVVNK